ncbi:MAG TPA: hypothetical protein VN743_07600 [Blastocatellia bacterium]|nr:hypothetical protein [Blastocatellia bacterium]
MPSLDDLILNLENSKRQFGGQAGKRTEELLALVSQRDFSDADSLIRFHEALLFIRAFPQTAGAFRMAEKLLSTFNRRVDALKESGVDIIAFDYIEYSGIAETTLSGTFSYDIVKWLVQSYPASVGIDWERSERHEGLGHTLPRFLPLLYEDSLVEANIPYLDWLHAAKGKDGRDLEWLVERFERTKLSNREKAEIFYGLDLRIRWDIEKSSASRTRNMLQPSKVFYHRNSLIKRNQISLDAEFTSAPIEVEELSPVDGLAMQDMLRATTTVRYRELYGITHGDPSTVVRADVGRGVQIFLWGLPPERRLPLRAYHAGFTLKNGVPINYIEGITTCERMEIGFNTFYTFRDGESGWVYGKVLRLLNQLVGVTCISIDPYQLGFHNEEAIESGAFWFYRKLGFRPTRPDLAKLVMIEEKKISSDPKYRTPPRVLRRLSEGNAIYEAPGTGRGDWDRFAIRNVGLAVQRRMRQEFNGESDKVREASAKQVARDLAFKPGSTRLEQRAFEDFALVLALIPDLNQWTSTEKTQVSRIVRAKTGEDESRFARMLQAHEKLRQAIITLGEPTRGVS